MLATADRELRGEPFGKVALGLALFLMVIPLEPDLLWALHRVGRNASAIALWCASFLLVASPLIISLRRLRRYPARWRRGKGTLILTACILVWNLFGLFSLLRDAHFI